MQAQWQSSDGSASYPRQLSLSHQDGLVFTPIACQHLMQAELVVLKLVFTSACDSYARIGELITSLRVLYIEDDESVLTEQHVAALGQCRNIKSLTVLAHDLV